MKHKKTESGFSLIELMVVVAIVGILPPLHTLLTKVLLPMDTAAQGRLTCWGSHLQWNVITVVLSVMKVRQVVAQTPARQPFFLLILRLLSPKQIAVII